MKTLIRRFAPLAAALAAVTLQSACAPQVAQSTRPESPQSPPPPDAAATTANAAPGRRVAPPPPAVTPGVAEVITLVQAGVEESVVKAHMTRSTNQFSPSVEELIYLNDIGIPGPLVSSLIQQTTRQREQAAMAAAQTNPPPAMAARPAPPEAQVVAVAPVAPAPQAVPAVAHGQAAPAPVPVAAAPQQVVVVQPQLPAQVSYFYGTLSPYGTWMEVAPHGWCWQPTVAVSSPRWRPYLDRGRWLWTSSGWYWQSDYSWGWAPFHYGRWVLSSRVGWVWVPDTTWGPAWVTWRYSDSYCGWAPLPPECAFVAGRGLVHHGATVGITFDFGLASSHFSFVSWRRFCDRNPYYYIEPGNLHQVIFNQTTIINNYGTGSNRTVVNNGVPAARVQALTRTELQEVLIKDAPTVAGNLVKPDRLEKSGNQLVIYKPQMQGPQPIANIPAGAVPVFVRGSNGPVVTGYTTDPVSIATGFPVVAAPSPNSPPPSGTPQTATGASPSPRPTSGNPAATQPVQAGPTLKPAAGNASVPQVATPGHVRLQPSARPTAPAPVKTAPTSQASNTTPSAGAIVKPEESARPGYSPFSPSNPKAIGTPTLTPTSPSGALPSPRTTVSPAIPTVPTAAQPSVPSRPTFNPTPAAPTVVRPYSPPPPVAAPATPAPASRPAPVVSPAPSAPAPGPTFVPAASAPPVNRPSSPLPPPSYSPAPSSPVNSTPTPARSSPVQAGPTPARSSPAQAGPTLTPTPSAPASSASTPTSKSESDKKR